MNNKNNNNKKLIIKNNKQNNNNNGNNNKNNNNRNNSNYSVTENKSMLRVQFVDSSYFLFICYLLFYFSVSRDKWKYCHQLITATVNSV